MVKTEVITTRVTAADKAALIKLAAKERRTLAGLINRLMAEEMEKGAKA
jgi:hypothetical protein